MAVDKYGVHRVVKTKCNYMSDDMSQGLIQGFELHRKESDFTGRFVSVGVSSYPLLETHVSNILHPNELKYFVSLAAERRRISYLLGRFAAKKALCACLGEVRFADINIAPGVFKNPVIHFPMDEPFHVSITHSGSMACAIAFPAVHPLSLDIEAIDAEKVPAMATQYLESERIEATNLGLDVPAASTLIWTAKESLSKMLCTGMMCPFTVFQLHSIIKLNDDEYQGLYKNFTQYKFHSWLDDNYILTITLPKWTDISFDARKPRLMNST